MSHLLNNDEEIKPINTITTMDEIKTNVPSDATNPADDRLKQLENRLTELEKNLYCMMRDIVEKLDEHASKEEVETRAETETEKNIV